MQIQSRLPKKRRVWRIRDSIAISVLGLIVAITILFAFSPNGFYGLLLKRVNYTTSMSPQIRENDLLLIRKGGFNNVKVGSDISFISYRLLQDGSTTQMLITHRVKDIEKNEETGKKLVRTQGINAPRTDVRLVSQDGAFGTNRYIGTVVYNARVFGNIFAYLNSPFGITMILLNIGAIIALRIFLSNEEEHEEWEKENTK